MGDPTYDRMNVGRKVLNMAPKLAAQLETFHAWMIESALAVDPKPITTVVEGNRVVAVLTALGRFEVAEEVFRVNADLMARIVFFRTPTPLSKDPRKVYAIRLFSDGAAHYGTGPEPDHFEWDHDRDRWLARNMLRLAYEIAVAATAPPLETAS